MRIWTSFILPITRHFRRRRWKTVTQIFPEIESYKICDLGGSIHFWRSIGSSVPTSNVEIFNISTSAVKVAESDNNGTEGFKICLYDGKIINRPDRYFDLLICNSVIEHVPVPQRRELIREMLRVGQRVFLQTPANGFPVDPHFVMPFIHWLPKSIGYWLALVSPWRILARPSKEVIHEYFFDTNMLSERELRAAFPEAEIMVERSFGMTKAYLAIFR